MTLKELLKGKELPVKVRVSTWIDATQYYTITAYNSRYVLLIDNKDRECSQNIEINGGAWELYTEPKPKKVLHGYFVTFHKELENGWEEFYESDELFLKDNKDHKIIRTGRTIEVEI